MCQQRKWQSYLNVGHLWWWFGYRANFESLHQDGSRSFGGQGFYQCGEEYVEEGVSMLRELV